MRDSCQNRNTKTLYNNSGFRKYLTNKERIDFCKAAKLEQISKETFCLTLAITGCRISEALALNGTQIDIQSELVIFETLKKRRKGIYRAVPVPTTYIDIMQSAHNLQKSDLIWDFSRVTGWRLVHQVMQNAGVIGPHATPRGLRHAFGVNGVQNAVPIHMIARWLGHASITTTAIYAQAVGEEEHQIASRMW